MANSSSGGNDLKFNIESHVQFTADTSEFIRAIKEGDSYFSDGLKKKANIVEKVYKQLATSASESYARATKNSMASMAKLAVQHSLAVSRQIAANKALTSSMRTVTAATKDMISSEERTIGILTELSRVVAVVQGPLGPVAGRITAAASAIRYMGTSALVTGLSIAGMGAVMKAALPAAIDLQRTQGTLAAATDDAAAAMALVIEESRRTGANYAILAKTYAQVAAAAKGTALEGKGVVKIFKAINTASLALRLDVHQTAGAIKAIEQMISKGTVSSEELRQQLGERLPGAFRLAANAMGYTTKEFSKAVAQGKILAEDLLPKLADVLNERYGKAALEASTNIGVAIERLNNEISILMGKFLDGGKLSLISSLLDGLARGLRVLSDNGQVVSSVITGSLIVSLGLLAKRVVSLVTHGKDVALAMSSIAASASRVSKAVAPAASALHKMGESLQFIAFAFVGGLANPKKFKTILVEIGKETTKLVSIFASAKGALGILTAAVGVVKRAFMGLFALLARHPFGLLLLGISAVAGALDALAGGVEEKIKKLNRSFAEIDTENLTNATKKLEELKRAKEEALAAARRGGPDAGDYYAKADALTKLIEKQQKVVDNYQKILDRTISKGGANAIFQLDDATKKDMDKAEKFLSERKLSRAERILQSLSNRFDVLQHSIRKASQELQSLESGGKGNTEEAIKLRTRIQMQQKAAEQIQATIKAVSAVVAKEQEVIRAKYEGTMKELTVKYRLATEELTAVEQARIKKSLALAKLEKEKKIALKKAELERASSEEIARIKALYAKKQQVVTAESDKEIRKAEAADKVKLLSLQNFLDISKEKIKQFHVAKGTQEELDIQASIARKELAARFSVQIARAETEEEKNLIKQRYEAERKLLEAKIAFDQEAADRRAALEAIRFDANMKSIIDNIHQINQKRRELMSEYQAALNMDMTQGPSLEQKMATLQEEFNAKRAALQAWYDEQQIMYAGNEEKLAQIKAEFNQKELENLALFEQSKTQLMLEEEQKRNEAILSLRDQFSALFTDQQNFSAEKLLEGTKAFYKKFSDLDKLSLQGKLKLFGDVFGALSGLMESNSRKAFEVGKAAAIAQAVVDGIASAIAAWKWGNEAGGPPVGAAFAAISVAFTAAQIAKLMQTQFKGSKGASPTKPSTGGTGGGGGIKPPAQPQTTSVAQGQTVQVFVNGVISYDHLVNDIIPIALSQQVQSSDRILIDPASANGQLLGGA